MKLNDRIDAFAKAGEYLRKEISLYNENQGESHFLNLLSDVQNKNPWFVKENVLDSLNNICRMLIADNLKNWLSAYDAHKLNPLHPKRIALIMAGNIPVVGFHDFLCVLISGHIAVVKMSLQDNVLLPYITDILISIEPAFAVRIKFEEQKLSGFDAVIATGSNNSARYFDYYFQKYPHIIRKNRSSIAVLTGNESKSDLSLLADDICLYYGRGCRSVSALFVPVHYDFVPLFEALSKHAHISENSKFFNNYEYNKSVFLVNNISFSDTGFLLFQKNSGLSAPIGVVHYSEYDKIDGVTNFIEYHKEALQCVVSAANIKNAVPLGKAQQPSLNDYADNIDTINFLTTCV